MHANTTNTMLAPVFPGLAFLRRSGQVRGCQASFLACWLSLGLGLADAGHAQDSAPSTASGSSVVMARPAATDDKPLLDLRVNPDDIPPVDHGEDSDATQLSEVIVKGKSIVSHQRSKTLDCSDCKSKIHATTKVVKTLQDILTKKPDVSLDPEDKAKRFSNDHAVPQDNPYQMP